MRNLILGAALGLVAATASGGYGYWRGESAGKAALQASLDQQRAQALTEAAKRSAAADAVVARLRQANQTVLADAGAHTKETVRYAIRYVQAHPAPAACVLADQLVQRLDADIQHANAAAHRLR